MKHEPKKHFDVSKPRKRGPDPTSRPIIVGHHPMMPDPMIREEREKRPKPIDVSDESDETESLNLTQADKAVEPEEKAEVKPAVLPELSDISAPHETSPALTPSASTESSGSNQGAPAEPSPQPEAPALPEAQEHVPGAVFSPTGAAVTNPPVVTAHLATPSVHPLAKEPEPPTPGEPPAGQELHIPAGHKAVHHKPRIWVWVVAALIILIWAYGAVDVLTTVKLPFELFQDSLNS